MPSHYQVRLGLHEAMDTKILAITVRCTLNVQPSTQGLVVPTALLYMYCYTNRGVHPLVTLDQH